MGNNRAVATATVSIVQRTQYYPFGLPFGDAQGRDLQPYTYNGKQNDSRLQLNLMDYVARQNNNTYGRFTSMDPHAENYYAWSPYAYVGNNPMRRTDPTGMYWDDEKSEKIAESLAQDINKEIGSKQKALDKLNAKIAKNQAKGKDISQGQGKAAGIQADIDNLNSSVSEIAAMGDTKDQAFAFTKIGGEKGGAVKRKDGAIQMDVAGYGSTENGIHESTHGYDLWKNGANTRDNYFDREIKAYSRQYSYNSNSLPSSYWGGMSGLQETTKNWVIRAYVQRSGGGRHYLYGDFFLQGTKLYSPSYIEKLLDLQRQK